MIDSRLSFYTKFGDVFAYACNALAVGIAGWAWWRRRSRREEIVAIRKEKS
jgi:hypothetical protein